MLNVFTMACFIVVVFGILGFQFWSGIFHQRCRLTPGPISFVEDLSLCPNQWCFSSQGTTTDLVISKGFTEEDNATIFNAWCNEACQKEIAEGKSFRVWPLDHHQMRLCGGIYQCG